MGCILYIVYSKKHSHEMMIMMTLLISTMMTVTGYCRALICQQHWIDFDFAKTRLTCFELGVWPNLVQIWSMLNVHTTCYDSSA